MFDVDTVIGLDLSLSSTGWSVGDDLGSIQYGRIKTKASTSFRDRLDIIANGVNDLIGGRTFIVIEDVPSHGAFSIVKLGKVHGAVLRGLSHFGSDVTVNYVTPPVLKKFATGKGNANKDAVLADAIRRFNFQGSSNDEADACILMHLGYHLLGCPLVSVPESHKAALDKVEVV